MTLAGVFRMIACFFGLALLATGCGDCDAVQTAKVASTVKKTGTNTGPTEIAGPCNRMSFEKAGPCNRF